jgi:hypothetical protein
MPLNKVLHVFVYYSSDDFCKRHVFRKKPASIDVDVNLLVGFIKVIHGVLLLKVRFELRRSFG